MNIFIAVDLWNALTALTNEIEVSNMKTMQQQTINDLKNERRASILEVEWMRLKRVSIIIIRVQLGSHHNFKTQK